MSNDTTQHDTQITYTGQFFRLYQATNSNFEQEFTPDQLTVNTHPTLANIFYMDNIALDYTRVTSPAAGTRALVIAAILALAPSAASVTLTDNHVITTPAANTRFFTTSILNAQSAMTPLLAIRVNNATVGLIAQLISFSSASNAGVSTGQGVEVRFTKNPTVTGGAYAALSTSVFQTNTTFTSATGGTDFYGLIYKTSTGVVSLVPLNITFVNGDILLISVANNGALATTQVQINLSQNI